MFHLVTARMDGGLQGTRKESRSLFHENPMEGANETGTHQEYSFCDPAIVIAEFAVARRRPTPEPFSSRRSMEVKLEEIDHSTVKCAWKVLLEKRLPSYLRDTRQLKF